MSSFWEPLEDFALEDDEVLVEADEELFADDELVDEVLFDDDELADDELFELEALEAELALDDVELAFSVALEEACEELAELEEPDEPVEVFKQPANPKVSNMVASKAIRARSGFLAARESGVVRFMQAPIVRDKYNG